MLLEERMSKVETDVNHIQTEMGTWHVQLEALTDRVNDIATSLKSIVDVFTRIEDIIKACFTVLKKTGKWTVGILGSGLAAAIGAYLIQHFVGK